VLILLFLINLRIFFVLKLFLPEAIGLTSSKCIKYRLITGLRTDSRGAYSATPDPLARLMGGEGRKGKGRGRERDG